MLPLLPGLGVGAIGYSTNPYFRQKSDNLFGQGSNPFNMGGNAAGGFDWFSEALAGPKPPTKEELTALAEKQAGASRDLVNQQTRDNRPTQYTPFGSSEWIQDGAGNWTQRVSLNPADQQRLDANRSFGMGLLNQGQGLLGQQMNLGGLPGLNYGNQLNFGDKLNPLESGDAARQRSEDALFNRASARLDPMWQKRESQLQTQLANQGLDPTSEAYRSAMQDFNMGRNDAYSSAMNDSIAQGGNEASRIFGMGLAGNNQLLANNAQQFGFGLSANDQMFNQSLAGRQQGVSEQQAAQQFGLNNLGMGLNIYGATKVGMPEMPGFATAGLPQTPDYMGAGLGAYGMGAEWLARRNQGISDLGSGGTKTVGSAIPYMFGGG